MACPWVDSRGTDIRYRGGRRLDEQSGKPTRYNVYRADVREAVNGSRTVEMMEKYLRRKGYLTDFTGMP